MPFQKGKSGNPKGRPKMDEQAHRARIILHEHSPEAAKRCVEFAKSNDAKLAWPAIESILNRTVGKAAENVDLNVQGNMGFTVIIEGRKN